MYIYSIYIYVYSIVKSYAVRDKVKDTRAFLSDLVIYYKEPHES